MNYSAIKLQLQSKAEDSYRLFTLKLIPELGDCIGIRVPVIRAFAKELQAMTLGEDVIPNLWNSTVYEEKLLLAMLIGQTKYSSFDQAHADVTRFVRKINNWAVCDLFVSAIKPIVRKYNNAFYLAVIHNARSDKDWQIRFGLVMLLTHYNDTIYIDDILEISNDVTSTAYYVRMANAWLLSYVYLIDKNRTIEFLQNSKLDMWTINKAIQKIRESNRVMIDEKGELRKFSKSINC